MTKLICVKFFHAVCGWKATLLQSYLACSAGVIEAVGSSVSLFKVGDEVFYAGAIQRQGTNAEYHLVDERIVGHKPKRLDFSEAAALPLVALTAWEGILEGFSIPRPTTPGHPPPGFEHKVILIVAGAGGVGSIAIQIAKRLLGLKVVASASRPETVEYCRRMGADVVIDHR